MTRAMGTSNESASVSPDHTTANHTTAEETTGGRERAEPTSPCTASMASVFTDSLPAVAPDHVCQADLRADPSSPRRKVRATGLVAEVAVAPVQAPAEFSALLMARDPEEPGAETRPVRLVWQGQRGVPGVTVGAALDCVGLLCHRDHEATMFNPRYEIVAKKVQR